MYSLRLSRPYFQQRILIGPFLLALGMFSTDFILWHLHSLNFGSCEWKLYSSIRASSSSTVSRVLDQRKLVLRWIFIFFCDHTKNDFCHPDKYLARYINEREPQKKMIKETKVRLLITAITSPSWHILIWKHKSCALWPYNLSKRSYTPRSHLCCTSWINLFHHQYATTILFIPAVCSIFTKTAQVCKCYIHNTIAQLANYKFQIISADLYAL